MIQAQHDRVQSANKPLRFRSASPFFTKTQTPVIKAVPIAIRVYPLRYRHQAMIISQRFLINVSFIFLSS